MMTAITFEFTDKQIELLKEFNSKHYSGAPDNRSTGDAIHVVQRLRKNWIPYSDDISDYMDADSIVYSVDEYSDEWYESPEALVWDYYGGIGESCPIEIRPFSEVNYTTIEDANGDDVYIHDELTYIKAHGIDTVYEAYEMTEWVDEAFFFILDEARKYQNYQYHNLGVSRVFTYSMGYDNRGDLPVFRDMLLAMGKQLNEEEGK